MRKLITIFGPTASGKTMISIKLAKAIEESLKRPAVIINFDSLLFYRELSIGTAKPTLDEQMGIEHQMIDICSARHPINAADYVKMAEQKIEEALSLQKVPILVGGSGFYLRALLKGMYEAVSTPQSIKDEIDQLLAAQGLSAIRTFLQENDNESYMRIHENDLYRNCRAMEFYLTTGRTISSEREVMEEKAPYDLSNNCLHDWECKHIYLDLPKEQHFPIIQKRTREMIKSGLIEEVKSLLDSGYTGSEKPLLSIGYKETLDYLNGKLKSIEELQERIDISTRQLAKAQRTWFKKVTPKSQFSPLTDSEEIIQMIINYLN